MFIALSPALQQPTSSAPYSTTVVVYPRPTSTRAGGGLGQTYMARQGMERPASTRGQDTHPHSNSLKHCIYHTLRARTCTKRQRRLVPEASRCAHGQPGASTAPCNDEPSTARTHTGKRLRLPRSRRDHRSPGHHSWPWHSGTASVLMLIAAHPRREWPGWLFWLGAQCVGVLVCVQFCFYAAFERAGGLPTKGPVLDLRLRIFGST